MNLRQSCRKMSLKTFAQIEGNGVSEVLYFKTFHGNIPPYFLEMRSLIPIAPPFSAPPPNMNLLPTALICNPLLIYTIKVTNQDYGHLRTFGYQFIAGITKIVRETLKIIIDGEMKVSNPYTHDKANLKNVSR